MSVRIVISGLGSTDIEKTVKEIGSDLVTTRIVSDYEGATMIKNGQADYFIGACNTGGGGALAILMAVLGANRCAIVSFPGITPKQEKIDQYVKENRVAFGLVQDHIKLAVPMIVKALLAKKH